MRKVVLHHQYGRGIAWDTSGHGNHGRPADVYPDGAGALRWDRPSSRIDVPPDASLDTLGAFRCSITFNLAGDSVHRYNLVESQLSFALFIHAPFRLAATILDANGQWTGAFSTSQTVLGSPGWHRADCGHDGIATSWVALDGQIMAVNDNVPGPVRNVGPNGVSIGHWPEPVDQYTFAGSISEVWLWQNRPDPPVDDCCTDVDALAEVERRLRDRGWDLAEVRRVLTAIGAIGAEVRRVIPEPAGADFDRTAAQLEAALRASQWVEVGRLSAHLQHLAEGSLSDPERQRLAGELLAVMGDLLGDHALLDSLMKAILCDKTLHPLDDRRDHDERERPWTHWGTERDPADEPHDVDEAGQPPDDVGYEPGPKPKDDAERRQGDD